MQAETLGLAGNMVRERESALLVLLLIPLSAQLWQGFAHVTWQHRSESFKALAVNWKRWVGVLTNGACSSSVRVKWWVVLSLTHFSQFEANISHNSNTSRLIMLVRQTRHSSGRNHTFQKS